MSVNYIVELYTRRRDHKLCYYHYLMFSFPDKKTVFDNIEKSISRILQTDNYTLDADFYDDYVNHFNEYIDDIIDDSIFSHVSMKKFTEISNQCRFYKTADKIRNKLVSMEGLYMKEYDIYHFRYYDETGVMDYDNANSIKNKNFFYNISLMKDFRICFSPTRELLNR